MIKITSSRSHNNTAKRIAKKFRSEYNQGKGVDINTPKMAIEVETPKTIRDGLRQLQGFRKSVYIAGTNEKATEKALNVTKGTTVGVMDPKGNIIRHSKRKKAYV